MIVPDDIREISAGRNYEDNQTGERRGTRVFRVSYPQATPGPGQAIIDQIVKRYDRYEEPGGFIDAACLATTGTAAPEDPENCFNHLVSVQYSTRWWDAADAAQFSGGTGNVGKKPGGGGSEPSADSPANPLARPAHYSWGTITTREVLEYDLDGNLVATAAGVPFNPPYETEREMQTLTVERNTNTYDQEIARRMMDTVNDSDIRILNRDYDKGMVRLKTWTADTAIENNIRFWQERLVLWFRKGKLIPNRDPPEYQLWKVVLLNAGTKELRAGKTIDITHHQGHPDSEPWPLNTSGRALSDGYVAAEINYKVFKEFADSNFDALALDKTI